ncbi:hypothetical protein AAC387_Pa03g2473 [Persea americana]
MKPFYDMGIAGDRLVWMLVQSRQNAVRWRNCNRNCKAALLPFFSDGGGRPNCCPATCESVQPRSSSVPATNGEESEAMRNLLFSDLDLFPHRLGSETKPETPLLPFGDGQPWYRRSTSLLLRQWRPRKRTTARSSKKSKRR